MVKVIKDFKDFVLSLEESLCVFPVSEMHIALFMSHLFRKGIAPTSTATRLSALSFWHQIFFKKDPTSHFMIRRILKGMKKSRPSVALRPPLTFSDLRAMRMTLGQLAWTPYNRLLIWAMISLSFHAFLRAGEMTKSDNTVMLHQVFVVGRGNKDLV